MMMVVVVVGQSMMSFFMLSACLIHYLSYSCVLVEVWRLIALPDILILSFLTVSLTVLVSVTGFFLTTTSSLTNGSFVTSTSSLFNGTLISVLDFTGPCADDDVESLGGLFSTISSSWVTGTSIVFFSVIGSFVIVY